MKLKAYSHNTPLKHFVLHTVKRYLWLPFVTLVLSAALFVVTELVMENRMISAVGHQNINVRFAFNNAEMWSMFPIFLILFSLFSAYAMFSFLFKKKSSAMMLLTGISRVDLYLTRYIYGLLSTLLPILASFLTMHVLGASNVNKSFALDKDTFMILSMVALLVICSYTLAVIAAVLCGRKLEFIAVYAVFVVGGIAVLLFVGLLFNAFVHGFAYPIRSEGVNFEFGNMFDKYSWISPFGIFKDAFEDYAVLGYSAEYISFDVYSGTLLYFSVFTLALVPLSVWLFKRRNAEFDGKSNAHKVLSAVCSVIPALPLSSLVFASSGSVLKIIISLAVFALLSTLFYAFFNGTVREIFKSLKFVLPCTAAFAIFVLVLNFDLLRYSKKIPDIDDVESVVVNYKGKYDYSFAGSRSGTNCHIVSSLPSMQSLPVLTSKDDILIAMNIHEKIIEDGSMIPSPQIMENYSDTAVYVDYYIVYKLKNGREIIRSYSVMKLSTLYSTLEIENTSAYRECFGNNMMSGNQKPLFDKKGELLVNYDMITFYASDNMLSSATDIELSNEDKAALLNAIKTDKLNETVEEAYHPTEDCLGVLWLATPNPIGDATMGNPNYIAVYKKDVNILSFLESKGLNEVFNGSYEIKSINLYSYNYYGRDDVKKMSIDRSYMAHYNYNIFEVSNIYYDPSNLYNDLGAVPKDDWEDVLNNSRLVYFRDKGDKYAVITMINSQGEERVVTKFITE